MRQQNRHGKKRRKFDPAEKTRIVIEGFNKQVSVIELCRKERISTGNYYRWRKLFLEAGKKDFIRKRKSENKSRISQPINVIKKTLSGYAQIIDGLGSTSGLNRRYCHKTPDQMLKIIQIVEASRLSVRETLDLIGLTRSSYYLWRRKYNSGGAEALLPKKNVRPRQSKDENVRKAVFEILHSPPKCHNVNRTSWRMKDLRQVLLDVKGINASYHVIREIIHDAGYRWKKAKVVLTSNDPEYQEKLDHIKSILSTLGQNDRFFSIDEFGPFAVKMKGGRKLVAPNEHPSVPQFQISKGCLIVTAALELSTNQVTHFYSKKKNTVEMIKLLEILLTKYSNCKRIYLSWDAASWHVSNMLNEKIDEVNMRKYRKAHKTPYVELVPLPASAQFLNVIESIFSGMARAIIHNSNYASVAEAKKAIDRYFTERNEHFQKHPQKAGNKIWGKELVTSSFSEAHNCKDPKW